ncbi:GntR family transcriptional regulator [Deinococcus sonorensis]|uniref:GntR family transcriptional regulator n=2 Tax=Deinococcus sonorensis TaxID=309891 RepID=A0AAU7U5F9_9DEIO
MRASVVPSHSPTLSGTARLFTIDRSLNVPLGVQLRGQIEYGIAGGELARGSRLPSVRELSQELGLAHVTVAQVYKELLALGLIVTHPGRGTFVADAPRLADGPDLGALRQMLADTLVRAEQGGYTRAQIGDVLNVLLARGWSAPGGVDVLLVGLFLDVTSAYAEDLQAALRPEDRVRAITLEELRQHPAPPADVVLALAHRVAETRALLPGMTVIPVGFIPAPTTRAALATLSPLTRLAVVATFEEFLPTFLAGVKRYAPHVTELHSTHIHAPELYDTLARCDGAVYASGSALVPELMGDRPSFEYRHTIDPRDVERLVLPAVEQCRARTSSLTERP